MSNEKDIIYRQDAIDALDKHCDIVCQYSKKQRSVMCGACPLGTFFDVIENLPPSQQKIIYCKNCRKHNVHSGYKEDCCPLYEWRGMSYGHEHDYQYCSSAERKTDATD